MASSVKRMRTEFGITQQAFATLMGFSFVSVNKWENGGSTPTGLSAVVLALLESVLRRRSPASVAKALLGAAGVPLEVVRVLAALERTRGAAR